MPVNPSPIKDHFQHMLHLLDLEAEAEKLEIMQDLQRRSPAAAEATGYSLINLVIREVDFGLGGRVLLTLGKRNQNLDLPWTKLTTGSPVILSEETNSGAAQGWRGIVSWLNKDSIQVAFEQWPEPESDRVLLRLDRSSDEVTRQRQRHALLNASAAKGTRLEMLRDVLLGYQPPTFNIPENLTPFDKYLNESQIQAVQFAFSADDIAILHGPPGTGKTTAVVELIRQIVSRGQKVLAVAPSNLAVDNILEKLLATGDKAIRLGHPARVQPELREHTLDEMVENHPDARLAHKLTREAYQLRDQASKFTRARPEPGARQAMRLEAKQMLAEARNLEDQVVERLLDAAQIICATTTGLDRSLLGNRKFDWCIVDESSQSTEPGIWIPLQFADRLVLAGDHFQLPPTVISTEAAAQGFSISLLERLINLTGTAYARRLTVQYRMHHDIMSFSSKEFYEDSLVADPSVEFHLLQDLPGVAVNELTATAVHFIDTAGASYDEEVEPDGDSRFNRLEADLVVKKVSALLEAGINLDDIAVISPYSAQVKLLRGLLKHTAIEIDSVDGFQGREKEAVIVSLVRSNRDCEIGFLSDVRRMNVALTRARRKLIVIGDSATITIHPFYQRLVTYFEAIGAYHSVWEE
ncbi:MAG: AAA family ATPase [Anaerolineaceae bacterium]|nr:AAA family ATPase [Anaerolineaceae bacterium]